MVDFEKAYATVTGQSFRVVKEKISLEKSLDRILAEDVISDMDMPPFNKSAVDGYACKSSDLANTMEIVEIVPAGKVPEKIVETGKCTKIMTGAPLPEGADVIIMVEDVELVGENKIKYKKDSVKDNVCKVGEDIKKGQRLLDAGIVIKPQHIAVLAIAGYVEPLVYRKVKVAIISTGDELVEPAKMPQPGQIRNSNAYQLMTQVQRMGAIPDYVGIALDSEESTRKKLLRAFDGNDIILLSGGVSMGDFDFVPKVLEELGVELQFSSVAVQPGRPTVFGLRDRQFIFGLPGNPVSSFVQFEMLVKPLIYKISGHDFEPLKIRLPLATDYIRKRSTRLSWIPVRISNNGEVEPLEYHGSAHINALTLAKGLISVPIGKTQLKKGELVDVRQI